MKYFICLSRFLGILAFTLLFAHTGLTQERNAMERFDIQAFNQNKEGNQWNRTLSDGTKIRQWENHGKGYQLEITQPYSAYTNVTVFNYQGLPIVHYINFYNLPIGIYQEYNQQGNVVLEQNLEVDFAFSVDDLIQEMRDKFNIDITDTRKVWSVRRGLQIINGQEIPLYAVYTYALEPGEQRIYRLFAYVVDGTTGNVLYSQYTDLDGNPSILLVYQSLVENGKL